MTADSKSEKSDAAVSIRNATCATTTAPPGADATAEPGLPAPAREAAPLDSPIQNTAPDTQIDPVVKSTPPRATTKPVPAVVGAVAPAGAEAALAPATKPTVPPSQPFKAVPSLPFSMVDVIDNANGVSQELGERRFRGELEEDFDTALGRVEAAPSRPTLLRRVKGLLMRLGPRRWRNPPDAPAHTDRHVAFDGFHNNAHDEKTERDRRYGTIYTVSEYANAYIVRLEFPRQVPNSSLKRIWNLPDEMPDYDYTVSLDGAVLTIRAGVRGEAYRRLSYVSASFPSDFMTRIHLAAAVPGFKHRLRAKVLEIIVFKGAAGPLRRAA